MNAEQQQLFDRIQEHKTRGEWAAARKLTRDLISIDRRDKDIAREYRQLDSRPKTKGRSPHFGKWARDDESILDTLGHP